MKYCFTVAMLALVSFVYSQNYNYNYNSASSCDDSKAFLGIRSNSISDDKAAVLGFDNPYGSYITSIISETAAERDGLQPFDYVFGINDEETSRRQDLDDLLENYEPGDEVTIHFVRNGKKKSKKVQLGSPSQGNHHSLSAEEDSFLGVSEMNARDLEDEIGVQVSITDNSTAANMGMLDGDIITAINDFPVVDWQDVTTAINMLRPGEIIRVEFRRDEQLMQNSGPIQSLAEHKTQKRLVQTECCAFIGVNFSQLSDEKAKKLGFDNPYGLYVTKVLNNSAAEKAGVRPFDYIYGVDEYRVGRDQTLGYILKKYSPSDKATLHIMRNGRRQTLLITLGRKEDVREVHMSECDEPFFGIRQYHRVSSNEGVPVSIVGNSTAEEMGMENGDVILTINGHKIIDWTDISTAIDNMQVGATIRVEYLRGNQKRSDSHSIKSHCDTKENSNEQALNWSWKGSDATVESKVDVRNVQINIQDISTVEIRALQEKYNVPVDTDNNLRPQRLAIQPNTTGKNVFYLQFALPNRGDTSIRIFNETGRLIYEYELSNFSGTFNDEVDLGVGAYYLLIKQGSNRLTKKVVLKKA